MNEKQPMPRVAWLGTGIMGLPMAHNLLVAGYPLSVWNRTPEKSRPLAADGAVIATSPAAAADGSEFIVVMVSDGTAVDSVLFGEQGACSSLAEGACIIVSSTLTPQTARDLARQCAQVGAAYLDAPVSGGEKGAKEGRLVIMCGGDAETFARAQPLLSVTGVPKYIGAVGCGQLAKLANQAIVGATIAVVAEALILAQAGGANGVAVRDALMGGFADSLVLRQHGERMLKGDFTPGGPAKYQLRDLQNAAQEAANCGVEIPITTTATGMFAQMIAAGFGEVDHSALYQFLKERVVT